ncbi:MAG: hypothetical protein R3B95_06800 [Nitrospirales bacterium]|nr:hypothetical protein [Nitrospirales bacterium]
MNVIVLFDPLRLPGRSAGLGSDADLAQCIHWILIDDAFRSISPCVPLGRLKNFPLWESPFDGVQHSPSGI